MCGFGDRLQYSVFECRFSPVDLAKCRHALGKLIHHREDQVHFVDLGPADGRGHRVITSLGRAYSAIDAPCIIVDRDAGDEDLRGTKRKVEALERARSRRSADTDQEWDDDER